MSNSDSLLVRDADAMRNFEIFLISAIGTILVTRLYLHLAGYPQVGGEVLHIAHMLWGGLLMLAALFLLVAYLNLSMRVTASVIGGIGFGLFIDELGKFITTDNDYFFQPTIALLYILFVLLFLAIRWMVRSAPLTEREKLINRELREGLVPADRDQPWLIRSYLGLVEKVRQWYSRVVEHPKFRGTFVTVFVVVGLGHGIAAVTSFLDRGRDAGWMDNLYLASTFASSLFLLAGIVRLRFDRLQALRLLRVGILISLALSQVFLFYVNELAAVGGLLVDLTMYAALNGMIRLEEEAAQ